jgi:glycosyltransferase involved in cell wall biosynthesis
VVAERMFWGCVPITTKVSMVPEMVANGERGFLVQPEVNEIAAKTAFSRMNPEVYNNISERAMTWSRQFALEKFEWEISKLLSQ